VNYDGKSDKAGNSQESANLENDYTDRAMSAFKNALARMDANPGAAVRIRHLADVTDAQLAEKEVLGNVRNLAAPPAEAPARAEAPTQAVDDIRLPSDLAEEHSVAVTSPGALAAYTTGRAGPSVLRKLHEWVSSWARPQDYLAGFTFRLQLEIPRPAHDGMERFPVVGHVPVSFWDVLDPTEREVLRSMASWRTFAAGARIMAEGERAEHVMVILDGQVKVGVYENGAHPQVLDLAQNLLDHGDAEKQRRAPILTGENCTVLLTDVVGFGARSRTDSDRRLIRKTLFQMTQTALQGMPDAQSEDRGDGILTVVPPNVSTMRVVDRVLEKLAAALELHNRTHPEPVRFKLRLAVNVGPVANDIGVTGEALIVAARLVDAPRFKEAIAGSAASLGVIVSPFVYETVIRHSTDPREVASYFQVLVEVKESITTAWMKLLNLTPAAFWL
jgi:CRP-like cAMP-binding protein